MIDDVTCERYAYNKMIPPTAFTFPPPTEGCSEVAFRFFFKIPVCIEVWSAFSAWNGSTRQSFSWSAEQRNMFFSPSPFAPENLYTLCTVRKHNGWGRGPSQHLSHVRCLWILGCMKYQDLLICLFALTARRGPSNCCPRRNQSFIREKFVLDYVESNVGFD